jgi:D,D-heptose 1,7-bisphosphate phosphatase
VLTATAGYGAAALTPAPVQQAAPRGLPRGAAMPAPVQCVILIRPLGAATPGAWLSIGGRPFLDYLLLEAWRFGFRKVLFIADGGGSRARASLDATQIDADKRLVIEIVEAEGTDTGGALYAARSKLDEQFLLLDGHCWFDFNWLSLLTAGGGAAALATFALREFDRGCPRKTVHPESPLGRALADTLPKQRGLASGGVALVSARIVEHLSPVCSLEDDIFPRLARQGAVRGVLETGRFIDVADQADRVLACSVSQWRSRPAVFLDRDGTLNADVGYVHREADFRWFPGAIQAVRRLNESGYYVFVVTNQSGVARGLFDEAAVRNLNGWMNEELRAAGAHVDDMRYCPHHPDTGMAPYRVACGCRKPGPGMLFDLMERWPIIEEASIAVGDSERDVAAGRAAGIASEIVPPGGLPDFVDRLLAGRDALPTTKHDQS